MSSIVYFVLFGGFILIVCGTEEHNYDARSGVAKVLKKVKDVSVRVLGVDLAVGRVSLFSR